mmetsp:Transcript_45981/g.80388  ORF Transcript_45981/g.80388 Transcript_45981/m.80388 type:complete len:254 (-) Transcript_45981:577-1338(-)
MLEHQVAQRSGGVSELHGSSQQLHKALGLAGGQGGVQLHAHRQHGVHGKHLDTVGAGSTGDAQASREDRCDRGSRGGALNQTLLTEELAVKASTDAGCLGGLEAANGELRGGEHRLEGGDHLGDGRTATGEQNLLHRVGGPASLGQQCVDGVLEVHERDGDKILESGARELAGVVHSLAERVDVNGRLRAGRQGLHGILTLTAQTHHRLLVIVTRDFVLSGELLSTVGGHEVHEGASTRLRQSCSTHGEKQAT